MREFLILKAQIVCIWRLWYRILLPSFSDALEERTKAHNSAEEWNPKLLYSLSAYLRLWYGCSQIPRHINKPAYHNMATLLKE